MRTLPFSDERQEAHQPIIQIFTFLEPSHLISMCHNRFLQDLENFRHNMIYTQYQLRNVYHTAAHVVSSTLPNAGAHSIALNHFHLNTMSNKTYILLSFVQHRMSRLSRLGPKANDTKCKRAITFCNALEPICQSHEKMNTTTGRDKTNCATTHQCA